MAKVQQFEFFTLNSNKFVDNRMEITSATPIVIGELRIDDVAVGDLIWLNGVVGVDNDDKSQCAELDFRIFKDDVFITGNEIYYAVEELDKEDNGDAVNVPISHVDVIKSNAESSKYVLTVQKIGYAKPVYVGGPITFTAAKIRPAN